MDSIFFGKLNIEVAAASGIEAVVKRELVRLGYEPSGANLGRIEFEGTFEDVLRANVFLRSANRVRIVLAKFKAETFDELFDGIFSMRWQDVLTRDARIIVDAKSVKSKLFALSAVQSVVKKAIISKLSTVYNGTFDESGAPYCIEAAIVDDVVTVTLDTSGEGLHKRGYRRTSNAAPIKETLAAGIIDLARVRADSVVCDPMCGSGTFLIEAAYKALNVAPGLRRSFAAEKWDQIPAELWRFERAEAMEKLDREGTFHAYGSDIDPASVDLSIMNAKKAGVASKITVKEQDVMKFTPPEGSITICNPPYGERMLEIKQAEELYKRLGERIKPDSSHPAVIISPDEDFEKFFGKKADKKRKLYNGMIKCNLYMYFK